MVNAEEAAAFWREAEAAGMSLSAWLRLVAREAIRRAGDDPQLEGRK